MLLNKSKYPNPVRRYYDLLVESGVIDPIANQVLIDCSSEIAKSIKAENLILLQQGNIDWDISDADFLKKIKFAITCSPTILRKINDRIQTYLLEFPLRPEFKKTELLAQRQKALYYHGRIIKGKLPIEGLKTILKAEIEVVLRGPISCRYWQAEKIDDEEHRVYDSQIQELLSKYPNLKVLPETQDSKELIKDLNSYKFYFTLSPGEAFNLALQEAIACGTIPLVKNNGAYWWAHELYAGFEKPEGLIKLYEKYYDRDLEEYSNVISEEIQKRCSFEAIRQKFIEQQKQKS